MSEIRPIRVLLVEDVPTQLQLVKWMLETADDMIVTTASDGLEGLARAWSDRPDVILLDLVLPGISGLELLQRYRSKKGPARVIVITGASDNRVTDAALAAGATFVLLKPVELGEVIRRIRFFAGGLTRLCENLLQEMNAPPKWAGFRQAARCAGLLGERKCELLKEAYIQVASENQVEWTCVAKNIERLIRKLDAEQSPIYQELIGLTQDNSRPTNGDFLRMLAQAAMIPL